MEKPIKLLYSIQEETLTILLSYDFPHRYFFSLSIFILLKFFGFLFCLCNALQWHAVFQYRRGSNTLAALLAEHQNFVNNRKMQQVFFLFILLFFLHMIVHLGRSLSAVPFTCMLYMPLAVLDSTEKQI